MQKSVDKLIVSLEHRFVRTPDGVVWSQTMFHYPFWRRYLEVFNQINVVARIKDVEEPPLNWEKANGPGVKFSKIPYYVGPWQFLQKAIQVRQAVRNSFQPGYAVILRSGFIGGLLYKHLRKIGYPFGIEVVGDPYDVFSPGAFKTPLRPFLRWWSPHRLRQQCYEACAAAYVTAQALQRLYPPGPTTFSTYYSDVELTMGAYINKARIPKRGGTFTIITVGSLNHFYKAPDILIEAVAVCLKEGLNLRLVFVGDGRHRQELEALALARGLGERAQFLGQLTAGRAVREQLDKADLFVLPSRQEGLPRAMLEAMARGLPCIGSTVGGIPELLPSDEMVPPGDVKALAQKIKEIISNPDRMATMSARNLAKAKEYQDEKLRERRNSFYRHVKEKTEEWQKYQGK